jgi:hypothetical protein
MKLIRSLLLVFAVAGGLAGLGVVSAQEGSSHAPVESSGKGELVPVTDKTDASWLAKARKDYPLTTCAVSGDELEGGDMGKAQDFIYRETGKPDRLVRFCCKDCLKDFRKEPAKYLKVISGAAAKKDAKQ